MFQWLTRFFRQDAIFQPTTAGSPATARDVEKIVQRAFSNVVTKEYLNQALANVATKEYVDHAASNLATKEYVKKVVDDGIAEFIESVEPVFQNMATKEDLKSFATKEDLAQFATKEDLAQYATKEDLERGFKEQRYYFDASVENIEDSLRGANKKLDQRVTIVERQIGLPAA